MGEKFETNTEIVAENDSIYEACQELKGKVQENSQNSHESSDPKETIQNEWPEYLDENAYDEFSRSTILYLKKIMRDYKLSFPEPPISPSDFSPVDQIFKEIEPNEEKEWIKRLYYHTDALFNHLFYDCDPSWKGIEYSTQEGVHIKIQTEQMRCNCDGGNVIEITKTAPNGQEIRYSFYADENRNLYILPNASSISYSNKPLKEDEKRIPLWKEGVLCFYDMVCRYLWEYRNQKKDKNK